MIGTKTCIASKLRHLRRVWSCTRGSRGLVLSSRTLLLLLFSYGLASFEFGSQIASAGRLGVSLEATEVTLEVGGVLRRRGACRSLQSSCG